MKKILAPIFTHHMVLQRNKLIPFWGMATPNSTITLTLGDITQSTVSDEKGAWKMSLPAQDAATGLTLTVSDGTDSVILTDIAIGEVWLAGGQSNMEFSLEQSSEWSRFQDVARRNFKVRFFYTPKLPYINDAYQKAWEDVSWELVTDEGFHNWSSIGYQYASLLAEKLGVTVGIIGCNWGGTSASAWMSREAILQADSTVPYITEYEKGIEGISLEEQYRAYDQYEVEYNEWNRKCGEMYAKNPSIEWSEVNRILGECQWPGPMNAGNPFRPCGLYQQMLQVICPYALRGFIFYQGESDDHRPKAYYDLCTNMIQNWRRDWNDMSLPFLLTQLPMHRYSGNPDYKNWPIIREAQLHIFENLAHTGIAVIPDCGEWNEIHPKSKATVSYRLALQAMYHVYGLLDGESTMAPYLDYAQSHDSVIDVYFKYSGDALVLRTATYPEEAAPLCPANPFEVAGEDLVFHEAKATIIGNALRLSSEAVAKPLYARYLWSNYCLPTLYGRNGLPVSPFRTSPNDGSDSFTGFADVQQIMET